MARNEKYKNMTKLEQILSSEDMTILMNTTPQYLASEMAIITRLGLGFNIFQVSRMYKVKVVKVEELLDRFLNDASIDVSIRSKMKAVRR